MNKKINKKEILNACIEKQQMLIDNYRQRIADIQTDVYSKNEIPSQSDNRIHNKQEVQRALINQLTFAQQELFILESLKIDGLSEMVAPGSVVDTGKKIFFIGVSSEKVSVQGKELFGISPKAPIYVCMNGLKKGDRFKFNGIDYEINDVY